MGCLTFIKGLIYIVTLNPFDSGFSFIVLLPNKPSVGGGT